MTAAPLILALVLASDPGAPVPPPPSAEERAGGAVAPPDAEEKGAHPAPIGDAKTPGPRSRGKVEDGAWPKDGGRWKDGVWPKNGGGSKDNLKWGRSFPGNPDWNRERWFRLSPEERDRLRKRYESIRSKLPPGRWDEIRKGLRESNPDERKEMLDRLNKMAEEGRSAVHAARWVDQALRSLPPEDLARLRDLPREKRAEEVAKLVEAFRARWRQEGEEVNRATFKPEEIQWLRSLQPPFHAFNVLAGKEPAQGKISESSLEKWRALSSEKRRQAAFWLIPPPPPGTVPPAVRPPGPGRHPGREGPPGPGLGPGVRSPCGAPAPPAPKTFDGGAPPGERSTRDVQKG